MSGWMMTYPLTLNHILQRADSYYPEREVVSREADGSVSRTNYGAIAERSRRLAAALNDLGIRQGERVATLGWNHANHLEAYFGVPLSGAVLHTINPRLHIDDVAYVMRAAEDKVLLIDQSCLPGLADLPKDAWPEHVIVWSAKPSGMRQGAIAYEDLLASASASSARDLPTLEEDDAASMCFTSATTGDPKGVVYTHRGLVLHSIVEAMPDEFNLSSHDVVMPAVPMFHVNAWGLPYTAAMVGAKLVLPGPQLDAASLLELIVDEGVTFTAGVPTVWARVLEAVQASPETFDLSRLRTMLVGGSAVPPAMIEAFDSLGVGILHAWGMTETTPLGSVARLKPGLETAPHDEQIRFRATQGRASPLVEARVMTPDGSAPWDGETIGELEVRGPWIAGSYLAGAGEDKFTDDGWLRTGDIAAMDMHGYIKISDRVSDLIKSGGEWISSIDLENVLMEHDAVREAAVIALPDAVWGERPLAVVVKAKDVDPVELLDFLRERFAKWQVPDGVVFVEEIPKTATGKFSKKDLRAQIDATAHASDAPPTPKEG